MNIPIVIQALRELSNWLEGSLYKNDIIEIIEELENTDINEFRLRQLKNKLSTKILFHPKCLGDIYIPNFIGDGSIDPWYSYLSQVADLCQKNL